MAAGLWPEVPRISPGPCRWSCHCPRDPVSAEVCTRATLTSAMWQVVRRSAATWAPGFWGGLQLQASCILFPSVGCPGCAWQWREFRVAQGALSLFWWLEHPCEPRPHTAHGVQEECDGRRPVF